MDLLETLMKMGLTRAEALEFIARQNEGREIDPGFAPLEGEGERVRDPLGKYKKIPYDPPKPFDLRGEGAEYQHAYNQGGRA